MSIIIFRILHVNYESIVRGHLNIININELKVTGCRLRTNVFINSRNFRFYVIRGISLVI